MCDCHVTEVMQPLWPAEMNWSLGGLENVFLEYVNLHSTDGYIHLGKRFFKYVAINTKKMTTVKYFFFCVCVES